MRSNARRKMIESAATLLAMRGVQGTAFSDVLERSGAPRGSIYHHFPSGKDQLEKRIADPHFVIDPPAAIGPTLDNLLEIGARFRHLSSILLCRLFGCETCRA